jgi:hypothetical protein
MAAKGSQQRYGRDRDIGVAPSYLSINPWTFYLPLINGGRNLLQPVHANDIGKAIMELIRVYEYKIYLFIFVFIFSRYCSVP